MDSRWLFVAGGDIKRWDLTAPNIPASRPFVLRGRREGRIHPAEILALSADDRWLAAGTTMAWGGVRLWDLAAEDPRRELVTLVGTEQEVMGMGFSPDGRWFVTVEDAESGDGLDIRLWPTDIDDLVKATGPAASRNLTEREWKEYFPGQPYRKTLPKQPIPVEGEA